MVSGLFFLSFLVIGIDIFLLGTIVGFFQKKFKLIDLFRFLIPAAIISFVLFTGIVSGQKLAEPFSKYRIWYAATIIFILSLKLAYDGIRLGLVKKTINPLDNKGLIYLSILMAINAFFIGLGFGFLNVALKVLPVAFISLFFFVTGGYLRGFSLKKLINFKSELLFAFLLIIVAIVIVVNF